MRGIAILMTCCALLSCKGEAIDIDPKENFGNYKVMKLFTVDGCTVYRFNDVGVYYFTTCEGSVQWKDRTYYGKYQAEERHAQIQTTIETPRPQVD